MKAIEKLEEISRALASHDIEAPEKEAELFLKEGLLIDIVGLYRDNPDLTDEQMQAIEEMVDRRSRREPLQYILGYSDFLGLKILVGHGVLIPRPETELMAEHAIKTVESYKLQVTREYKDSSLMILDLCTGSGCLALALAKEFPEAKVYGTDISDTAISYAERNAVNNRISNAEFFKGHLFNPLALDQSFDMIISNPPYIRTDDIKNLQPEICDWEPFNALNGGHDGLDFYREIIPGSRKFLRSNGILMLELNASCADDVANMMEDAGYTKVEIQKDYAGIKRIIQARWIK